MCERPEKLGCSQKRGEVLASSLFRIMCGVTTYFFVTKKEKKKKEKDIHMAHIWIIQKITYETKSHVIGLWTSRVLKFYDCSFSVISNISQIWAIV